VDGNGSESYSMVGFGISSVEPSGFATNNLLCMFNSQYSAGLWADDWGSRI
jgi:hypothetical protein